MRRWRSVSSGSVMRICRKMVARAEDRSGEQVGGDAATEKAAAAREGQRRRTVVLAARSQAERFEPRERARIERRLEPREVERLAQPQAEHHALAAADLVVELLERARRRLAARQRRHI